MPDKQDRDEGADRAAILLLALDRSLAASVVRHFSPDEAARVGSSMLRLDRVSHADVMAVAGEFLRESGDRASVGAGQTRYVQELFDHALGPDRSRLVLDRILPRQGGGLDALQWMDARAIAELTVEEHPQVVAVLLSCLEEDRAAAVLELFTESRQADVVARLARLGRVRRAALVHLDEALRQHCAGPARFTAMDSGGLGRAAGLLRRVGRAREGRILDRVQESDPELCRRLQELRSGIGALLELDDAGLRTLLRTISLEVLAVAMSDAEHAVLERILRSLSRRRAENLRTRIAETTEAGSVEIANAQEEILFVVRRMRDAGDFAAGDDAGSSGS